MGKTLAALVGALLVIVSGTAHAHVGIVRTELEATRDAPGTGIDLALAEGTWSADVLEVDGKPGQAFILISVTDRDGNVINRGIGGHPVVGGKLRSNQIVPAGIARLRLTIWGGGNAPARVRVAMNHP